MCEAEGFFKEKLLPTVVFNHTTFSCTVRTKKCGVAANQSRKCRYLAAKILDFWTLRKRKHSGKNYQYQKTSRKWAITTHREIRWTCGWELHTDIYIRIWLILLCKTKDWTVVHEPETHVKYHAMRTSGFVRTLRDYFKTQSGQSSSVNLRMPKPSLLSSIEEYFSNLISP